MPTRFQAAFECATRGQRVPTLPCCIKKQLENYNHSNEFAFSFNLSNKISALTLMEFLYLFGIFFFNSIKPVVKHIFPLGNLRFFQPTC